MPPIKGKFELGLVDYHEVLKKDFRALQVLGARFKRVEVQHKDLMNEIDAAIQMQVKKTLAQFQDEFASPPQAMVEVNIQHEPTVNQEEFDKQSLFFNEDIL